MAKLSEENINEIIRAFLGDGDNPSEELINALGQVTKDMTGTLIKKTYVAEYKDRHNGTGPYDPVSPSMG